MCLCIRIQSYLYEVNALCFVWAFQQKKLTILANSATVASFILLKSFASRGEVHPAAVRTGGWFHGRETPSCSTGRGTLDCSTGTGANAGAAVGAAGGGGGGGWFHGRDTPNCSAGADADTDTEPGLASLSRSK